MKVIGLAQSRTGPKSRIPKGPSNSKRMVEYCLDQDIQRK